jgi:hypothetical protein
LNHATLFQNPPITEKTLRLEFKWSHSGQPTGRLDALKSERGMKEELETGTGKSNCLLPTSINQIKTPARKSDTETRRHGDTENMRYRDTEKPSDGDADDTQETEEVPPLAACVKTLPEAVQLSLDAGLTEKSLFIFARALKAFEITNNRRLPPLELQAAFVQWWNASKAILPPDADFDEWRFDFEDTFAKTHAALGANPLRESPPILKRFHRCGDFQHGIAHCRQPVILVGFREQFRLHHARPVCQREEFHRLAGNLVMRPLLDHQPARHHGFADVFAQPLDGAVSVPSNVRK